MRSNTKVFSTTSTLKSPILASKIVFFCYPLLFSYEFPFKMLIICVTREWVAFAEPLWPHGGARDLGAIHFCADSVLLFAKQRERWVTDGEGSDDGWGPVWKKHCCWCLAQLAESNYRQVCSTLIVFSYVYIEINFIASIQCNVVDTLIVLIYILKLIYSINLSIFSYFCSTIFVYLHILNYFISSSTSPNCP